MNTPHTLRPTFLGLVLTSLLAMSPAHAETTNCTAITSLPTTITSQGVYCLTGNLGTSITSGNAVTINANNVTLDMNGFKLGGLGAGDGTLATGISAFQRKNITIKNGIIRGFYRGIRLYDNSPYTTSQGHVVQNILADQNTRTGIELEGRGITLRNSRVVDTGGSTQISYAVGIDVTGSGINVLDNQVIRTTSTDSGNATGILLNLVTDTMVKDNRLSEVVALGTGAGSGITILNSSDVVVRNNLISQADSGISYVASSGLYGGNYTSNVTTPFTGGTPAGSSNYSNP